MFSKAKPKTAEALPFYVVILLTIAVIVELFTGVTARIDGADSASHLIWIQQFVSLVHQGVWLPKWLPDGFHGVGSPTFYYYPPLAYYLAWIVSLFGVHDPTALFHIVAEFSTIASAGACYLLLRRFAVSTERAIIGSLLYGFAPFRVAELYSRSSLSSHVGYVFIPLVALALLRLFEKDRRFDLRSVVLLTVSTAGLILSSIPALACAVCFGAVGVAIEWRRITLRVAVGLLAAIALTVGATAFYIIPAAQHTGDAQISRFYKDPYFFITELLKLHITVELVHTVVLVMAIGLALYALGRENRRSVAGKLAVSAIALVAVLQLPLLSLPLWRHIAFLQFIQVPWRLYIGLILAISVIVAVVRSRAGVKFVSYTIALLAIAAIGSSMLPLFNLHAFSHWVSKDADPPEYLAKNASMEIVHQSELPDSVRRFPKIDGATAAEAIVMTRRTPTAEQFSVQLKQERTVHFRQLYWPNWILWHDGQQIPSYEDTAGFQSANLPAGSYTLTLRLDTPPSEQAARTISLASFVAIGAIFSLSWLDLGKTKTPSKTPGSTKPDLALDVKTTHAL